MVPLLALAMSQPSCRFSQKSLPSSVVSFVVHTAVVRTHRRRSGAAFTVPRGQNHTSDNVGKRRSLHQETIPARRRDSRSIRGLIGPAAVSPRLSGVQCVLGSRKQREKLKASTSSEGAPVEGPYSERRRASRSRRTPRCLYLCLCCRLTHIIRHVILGSSGDRTVPGDIDAIRSGRHPALSSVVAVCQDAAENSSSDRFEDLES